MPELFIRPSQEFNICFANENREEKDGRWEDMSKKEMKREVYKRSNGLGMAPIGHLKEEKCWISPKIYTGYEGVCVASHDRRNASCCQASPRHLCCVSGAVCGRTWLLDRQTCQHNFVPSKKTKQLFPQSWAGDSHHHARLVYSPLNKTDLLNTH